MNNQEYQGPYKCVDVDCGAVIQGAAVSLATTVLIQKPDGSKSPVYGSYLFCKPCADKRGN